MKSRGSLVLMELLVMILVFALASALCLQVFAGTKALSDRTARMDEAVLLAQNAAQLLKATRGDPEALQALSSGEYRLEIQHLPDEIPGLGQAEIRVYFEEDCLICLGTGWQEVIP